ncbi:MAG: HEPN domain-containing protein, partial [Clostridia bacterium]
SNYDLETIDVLIKGERWVYVAYVCQQAVERQLKGLYVRYTDKEAPKTHNLNFLFAKICECAGFSESAKSLEPKILELEDFLVDIMFYYMSDYPFSYKNIMNRFIDKNKALELYEKTKLNINLLRGLCE